MRRVADPGRDTAWSLRTAPTGSRASGMFRHCMRWLVYHELHGGRRREASSLLTDLVYMEERVMASYPNPHPSPNPNPNPIYAGACEARRESRLHAA